MAPVQVDPDRPLEIRNIQTHLQPMLTTPTCKPTSESRTPTPTQGGDLRRGVVAGNRGNSGGHRKSSSGAQNGARAAGGNKGGAAPSANYNALPTNEGGDALQNLQRVITDLKSISPPAYVPPLSGNTFISSASSPQQQQPPIASNLPPNAPVFQPGATAYPGTSGINNSPIHRKAASLGSSPSYPSNYTSPLQQFQSNLGSMVEDDDEQGNTFEEGEIPQPGNWQQSAEFPSTSSSQYAGLYCTTICRSGSAAATTWRRCTRILCTTTISTRVHVWSTSQV